MNENQMIPEEEKAAAPTGMTGAFPEPPADLEFDAVPVQAPVEEAPAAEAPAEETPVEEAPAEETPVEEAPAEEAVAEETPVEEAPAEETPQWLAEYVAATGAHSQNLRSLIKYTKEKDATIYKLGNELQKYREDYCAKTFKPIGMALISFREDCKKSIADLSKYEYDVARVSKHLDFLTDDYFEALSNVGVEEEDDVWVFNGMPLRQKTEVPAAKLVKPFTEWDIPEEAEMPALPVIKSADELIAYLQAVEEAIKADLARNEELDKCLKAYVEFSFNVEAEVVKLLVLPTIRTAVSVGQRLKRMVTAALETITEENCREQYLKCLSYVVGALDVVLLGGGIEIEGDVRDTFDPKKDQVQRTIPTEDPELDRKLATMHTDCYIQNERVIYRSRVDVYKYVPKAEEKAE